MISYSGESSRTTHGARECVDTCRLIASILFNELSGMEAALWCFSTTDTFRDAVLKAANLGDDADITAVICGQVAGAYYGIKSISAIWRNRVSHHDDIILLSQRLLTIENREGE